METPLPREPLKKGKPTFSLVLATLISAFGSYFPYGYNLHVLNQPAVLIQYFYNVTYRQRTQMNIDENLLNFLWDITICFFPMGGLVGSLLSGSLADTYGRKITLVGTSVLSFIAAGFMTCSKISHAYELMFVARVTIGLCAGISSCVVPMYLAEMAPPNLRGAIVMVAHLFFTIGVLMAQVFGLQQVLGTATGWPLLLGLIGIPAFLQVVLLPSFPESPRFLLIQEQNEVTARRALRELRGWDDVEDEMQDLRQEDFADSAERPMNIFKLTCFPQLRLQVFSVIVLVFGQQLTGINVTRESKDIQSPIPANIPVRMQPQGSTQVHYYLESIYLSTGIEEHVQYFGVLVTLALVLVTLGMIFVVDSWGRRCLLLIGFGICSFTCVFLTMSLDLERNIPWMAYLNTAFVILFLIGHTIGPASIPSLVTAELFLQSSRSSAYVIGASLHWLCSFITVLVFFHVEQELWTYTFLIFLPFCIATFCYILKVIPETKNKTFLEIRASLTSRQQ